MVSGYNNLASGYCSAAIGRANSVTGDYSFVVGYQSYCNHNFSAIIGSFDTITHFHSFILGSFSKATGKNSIVVGNDSKSLANYALSIGYHVQSRASEAFSIGVGIVDNPLINTSSRSLIVGFNSNLPTFIVDRAPGVNKTGRIGIGNVTDPQAKLHIRSDWTESALLKIENTNNDSIAGIIFGNGSQSITTSQAMPFTFKSGQNDYYFENGNVGIGTNTPGAKIQVKDGDIFIEDIDRGIIMKSPDGNCWRGTVSNQGQMQFIQIDCQTMETGIHNPESSNSDRIKIYPNPAGKQVFISFDETLGNLQLEISDINGQLLSNQTIRNSRSAIDLSTFQSGTYLFILTDESGKQVAAEKVIKE
jgi:hypothetical protein